MLILETHRERPLIDQSPGEFFRGQNKSEKVKRYHGSNIFLSFNSASEADFLASRDPKFIEYLESMKKLGWKTFGNSAILHSMAYVMQRDGLAVPFSGELKKGQNLDKVPNRNQINKDRLRLFTGIIDGLEFDLDGADFKVRDISSGESVDITDQVKEITDERLSQVDDLADYPFFLTQITKHVRKLIAGKKGLLVLVSGTSNKEEDPTIVIQKETSDVSQLSRIADAAIPENANLGFYTLKTVSSHVQLEAMQKSLAEAVTRGEVRVSPAITRSNWVDYGLMTYVKKQVDEVVSMYMNRSNLQCDPLDLHYQVMFRLTAFKISELFEDGQRLEDLTKKATLERGWRGLVDLDESLYSQSKLRKAVLDTIVDEQASIVATRLQNSPLPVDVIVGKRGIFGEVGWQIKKDKGAVSIIKRGENGQVVDQIPVAFKEVDIDYAKTFHRDFHYIHTPRGDKAYGFYLEGDDVPFSVLATQPVDRMYKRNTLLLFGFDPRNCVDFTRLYSRPGVPKNVSSAMFGETFSYLRQNEPHIEAAITAFMPTYASGLSMLTGGFETPFLIKPGVHYFSEKNVNGRIALEHLTKRRHKESGELTTSQFPLLPVIELIAPINEPRFKPVLRLKEDMVEL
jgi:hypothetical protein